MSDKCPVPSSSMDWLAMAVRHRVPCVVTIQTLIFAMVYLMSYFVRFESALPRAALDILILTLPLVVGLKLAIFLAMGCHRGWWRYNSFADMIQVTKAALVGSAVLMIVISFCSDAAAIPRSVVAMDWAGTLLAVAALRGAIRIWRERYHPMIMGRGTRRVLIVGASEAGAALVHQINGKPKLGMRVVGILDRSCCGRVIAGVRVLGSPADIRDYVARHKIEVVLAPTPAIPPSEVRALVAACNGTTAKVQVVPGFDSLLSGSLKVQPRDVVIDDLLCREPVRLDTRTIGEFLSGRVVLVTGAAGSIGSEICRQALTFRPRRLILLDHSENGLFFLERELLGRAEVTEIVPQIASITDAARLRTTFESERPDVVLHAAAHKHVPMMEANAGEAVKNNVFGTRAVVDEAVRAGVDAFVMISSDKAVNPTSVMGACKRAAEMYVQAVSNRAAGTQLVTVRFGNVLGSNGSVVTLFREQILHGGPVTVTHPEMTRFFMTIPEATQLVLQAGALGRGGEIFVLDMGKQVRVLDLARDLIRLSGLTEGKEIEIAFTGLRPGEKLYEELYIEGEERLPTPHPKIFRAQHRPCSIECLRNQFLRLERIVDGPSDEVISELREIVPEYKPNHKVSREYRNHEEVGRPTAAFA